MANILDTVIDDLQRRKGDWPAIAEKADVSYSWLTKFAQGKINNPGIRTVDRLKTILRKSA